MSEQARVTILAGEAKLCEGELVSVEGIPGTTTEDGKGHDVLLTVRAKALVQGVGEEPVPGNIIFMDYPEPVPPVLIKKKAEKIKDALVIEIEDIGVMDVAIVVGESVAYEFSITAEKTGEVVEDQPLYKSDLILKLKVVKPDLSIIN